MGKKKKSKFWKYTLFALFVAAVYYVFDKNGVNLIEEYPEQMGMLVILLITKIASKHFGINISWFFTEEMKASAGKAVVNAKRKAEKGIVKIGKRFKGWKKANQAAKEYQKETGSNKVVSLIVTQEVFRKLKKTNPELWEK